MAAIISTHSLSMMDEGQRMIIKLTDGTMINLVCMEIPLLTIRVAQPITSPLSLPYRRMAIHYPY